MLGTRTKSTHKALELLVLMLLSHCLVGLSFGLTCKGPHCCSKQARLFMRILTPYSKLSIIIISFRVKLNEMGKNSVQTNSYSSTLHEIIYTLSRAWYFLS